MKANNTNENGLGDTAEINNNETQTSGYASWRKMMDERDSKIKDLEELMREAKGTDPEAYFTAKDALQGILEEGIDLFDDDLLASIEPIWDGTARAKSGALIYLLQKK